MEVFNRPYLDLYGGKLYHLTETEYRLKESAWNWIHRQKYEHVLKPTEEVKNVMNTKEEIIISICN